MKVGKYWIAFVACAFAGVISVFQINASYHNSNWLFVVLAIVFGLGAAYSLRKV